VAVFGPDLGPTELAPAQARRDLRLTGGAVGHTLPDPVVVGPVLGSSSSILAMSLSGVTPCSSSSARVARRIMTSRSTRSLRSSIRLLCRVPSAAAALRAREAALVALC
jgi:hypothetical protein